MLCEGLAARLGLANRAVVLVPLHSSLEQLGATLRRRSPDVKILDACEVRGAGFLFLFLDALRQDPALASCPVLVVASGSFPDEERFRSAARQRDIRVRLDSVNFEELVEEVEAIIAGSVVALATVAD